ncbi:hypothetical protein AALP_AA6G109300 [Arabis alpina]|uniref:Pectinesterase inhibitor domain-containing protein n=1 Tax=Arabis alpina TaxID=50452 RepID=A0A087GNG5_ARAAL|nr:hypothetical protein AALP_AA6G109300 [Arabis alpina]
MEFLIYQVVFFLLFNGFEANGVADSLIRDSCKNASKYEEPYYYNFCIKSFKENPESQKVRNIDDLIVVGVKNAMKNMTNVRGIVEKILKERKYKTRLSEKLLRECLKLYSEGNDSLIKGIQYFKVRNYKRAHGNINDARYAPRTCEMKFNGDNNQTSPITKENDILFDLVGIPISLNFEAHIMPPDV